MLQYTKVRLGFTCADVWTCWVEIEERSDMVTWATERDRERRMRKREREREREGEENKQLFLSSVSRMSITARNAR